MIQTFGNSVLASVNVCKVPASLIQPTKSGLLLQPLAENFQPPHFQPVLSDSVMTDQLLIRMLALNSSDIVGYCPFRSHLDDPNLS